VKERAKGTGLPSSDEKAQLIKTSVSMVMEAAPKTQLNMKRCLNDRWPLSFS